MSFLLSIAVFSATLNIAAQPPKSDIDGFNQVVATFLKTHCQECHGSTKPQAKLLVMTLSPAFVQRKDWQTWALVRERIHAGEVPPEDQERPKQADLDKVLAWLDMELRNTESVGRFTKPAPPRVGWAIPTKQLFDGKHDKPFSAQPRLWHVSPEIYRQMVAEVGVRERKRIALPFAAANTNGASLIR